MSLPTQSNVRCEVVVATKQIVDRLLSANTRNRSVKQTSVERLVNEITEGRWEVTNNGIGVAEDGTLLDGQHRLLAMKEAGYPPVQFVLVSGIRQKAVAAIDVGVKRQNHDTIKLLLDRDAARAFVAACSTIANYRWKDSGWASNSYATQVRGMDLASVVVQYTPANSVFNAATAKQSFFRCGIRAALTVFASTFPIEAAELIRLVEFGEGLNRTMPAYWLRENCMRKPPSGTVAMTWDWSCSVRCINDFVMGRQTRLWKMNMAQDWCHEVKERMLDVDTH